MTRGGFSKAVATEDVDMRRVLVAGRIVLVVVKAETDAANRKVRGAVNLMMIMYRANVMCRGLERWKEVKRTMLRP